MIVFDVTDKNSFDNVPKWVSRMEEHCPKQAIKILVGNKVDLTEKQVVSTQTAAKWAKENDFELFMEISALDGTNIKGLTDEIGQKIFDSRRSIVSQVIFYEEYVISTIYFLCSWTSRKKYTTRSNCLKLRQRKRTRGDSNGSHA